MHCTHTHWILNILVVCATHKNTSIQRRRQWWWKCTHTEYERARLKGERRTELNWTVENRKQNQQKKGDGQPASKLASYSVAARNLHCLFFHLWSFILFPSQFSPLPSPILFCRWCAAATTKTAVDCCRPIEKEGRIYFLVAAAKAHTENSLQSVCLSNCACEDAAFFFANFFCPVLR